MLHAFAQRLDVGIAAHQAIIDQNAAINLDAGTLGERRAWPDTNGHHHNIGWQFASLVEADGMDPSHAQDGMCIGPGNDPDAAFLYGFLQKVTRCRIELPFHQGRHEMQDGHIHAAHPEPRGCFKAEQSAANDDRIAAGSRHGQHPIHIVDVTIGENARQIMPGHGNDDRSRTGRYHQPVIGCAHAVLGANGLQGPIDRDNLFAAMKRYAMAFIPGIVMRDNVLIGLFARQDRRKHDAVVVDARFGVEDRDLIGRGCRFEEMFEHAAGRHAIADDHEFVGHCGFPHAASTNRLRS